jgi:hypothetical protein
MLMKHPGRQRAENPFRDPGTQPDWAEFTRLGGDRVTILFEDLRKRIGAIEGLSEDMHYACPEEGWRARYCLGDTLLFTARIFPGVLEVTLWVNAGERNRLLQRQSGGAALGKALSEAQGERDLLAARLELKNSSGVRSFARWVVHLSKMKAGERSP